jgi:ABC-type antimicrobial peptide transport system permease subunit
MALGAESRDALWMVIRSGMTMALIGTGIGLIVSWAVTRLLRGMLFGVSATDPLTFIIVPLLLSVVTLVACYLPARRAAKMDPLMALRRE